MALQAEILEFLADGKHATIRQISEHTHARRTWVSTTLAQMVEQKQVLNLGRAKYANSPQGPYLKFCSAEHPPVELA
tara:strand:- start:29 stop:259 length:231 start_codon:yes stop_codon:yes gene_type:complete